MAVHEDIIRLKMEALGAEGLDRMEAKAKLLEGSLELLSQQLKAGAISEDDFEEHARDMITALAAVAAHVHVGRDIADAMKAAAAAAAQATPEIYEFADACTVFTANLNRAASVEDEAAAHTRAMEVALSDLGQTASRSADRIEKVNGVIPRITNRTKDAKAGMAGMSYGMQQVAFLADDLQYGFRGISNQLAPMLGMFGTWGSVLAIGAIGIYHITQNWNALSASFRTDLIDQKAGSIEKLTERMEELQKQTKLTSKEMQELDNLQIEVAANEAAKKDVGTATQRQSDVKAAYQDALSKDHGYASVSNAANSAVSKRFLDRPEEAIKEAADQGMLKDDKGETIKLDRNLWGSKNYMDMLKRQYLASVIPVLRQDLLKRIGKDGDEQALEELKRGMEKSGTYAVNEEGNVNDINGNMIDPLSALMRGAPEVRKRREQREADVASVAAIKGEQEEAFQSRVNEISKELENRVGAAIANGMKGKELEEFTTKILQETYRKDNFGGRKGPGVWVEAINRKVRDNINEKVNERQRSQNIRPEDAKALVAKDLNANANQFNNQTAENNRNARTEAEQEQEQAKEELSKALDSGVGKDLQSQIMAGLLANRRMAIPGKATARQKAQQAEDLARFKNRIIMEVRRELIQGGMDPGKAEDLAGQAPQHFIDQYNAWRLRQVAPGGGGIADPQNPTIQERARGVRPNLGQNAWQGPRPNGFHSVGVNGPNGGGESAGEEAVSLNRAAFQATAKTAETVGKVSGQVNQLAAAWPRLAQRLNQLERQTDAFSMYSRTAALVERG
jgi:hypothetical protein